jgi:hypothetical protein
MPIFATHVKGVVPVAHGSKLTEMTWKKLLAEKRVAVEPSSADEIGKLLDLARKKNRSDLLPNR